MKLLPYDRFSICTSDPPAIVRQRLAAYVEAPRAFRWSSSHNHAPYQGEIWEDGFAIHRIIHYRNSFLPMIRGRFEESSSGTIVHITMGLHPLVTIFISFWALTWYSTLIPLWLSGAFLNDVALVFLGVPTAMLGVFWWAFWQEANRSHDDLTTMITRGTIDRQLLSSNRINQWRLRSWQLALLGLTLALGLGQFALWQLHSSTLPEASSFTPCSQNSTQSSYCALSVRHRLNHPSATVLALSTDGQTLVSGGQDKAIRVWDVKTGQIRKTLQSDSGQIRALAIAPDGKTVVSGSADHRIRIWNLTANQRPVMLTGHKDEVEWIRITPDGQTLLSGSNSELKRWNLATEKLEATLATSPSSETHLGPLTIYNDPDRFTIRDISADGKTAILDFYNGRVVVWNLVADQPQTELHEQFDTFAGYVLSANISRDGKLAAIQYSNQFEKFETQLKVWDLTTGEVKARGRAAFSRTLFINVPMALSRDRIVGSTPEGLKIWNLQTAEPDATLNIEGMAPLVISADGKLLAGIAGDPDAQAANIMVLQRN